MDSFWISPYAFSCFVALKEKKLPFEVRTASLPDKEHLKDEYRRRSLTGRVPMLEHADFSLSESSAIVEYLDEAFPGMPRVLPATARDRGRARQIMAWVRSDLMPIREERPSTSLFYERATKPLSPAAEEAARRVVAFAQAVLPEGRTTLFGSGWSAADTDLAFMLQRLNMNGYELPAPLRKFAETQWQLPSVQEWVKRERLPYRPY